MTMAGLVSGLALLAPAAATPSPTPAPRGHDGAGCRQRLYDPDHRMPAGPDLRALRHDMGVLADDGATVRVRVYGRTPDGGLDARERRTEQRCPSWRHSGQRLRSLLVVTVAVQARQTGIYYGADFSAALDGHWAGIQQDEMNPRFQAGDWVGGLDAGLRALHQRISDEDGHGKGLGFWLTVAGVGFPSLVAVAMLIGMLRRPKQRGGGGTGGSGTYTGYADGATSRGGGATDGGGSGGGGSTSW